MGRSFPRSPGSWPVALKVLVSLVLVGCSGDAAIGPQSTDLTAIQSNPNSVRTGIITLTPSIRSAKPVGPVVTRSSVFTVQRGGSLFVPAGRGTYTRFRARPGALGADTRISMTVSGAGIGTQVQFDPAGLQFQVPAQLDLIIKLGSPEEAAALGGYLLLEDGSRVEMPTRIRVFGSYAWIRIKIPHFSIYTPDDGDDFADNDSQESWS